MKATIKYKDIYGTHRQKTIEVQKNEPNYIVGEFLVQCELTYNWAYIKTIKCGRYEYQWWDVAREWMR